MISRLARLFRAKKTASNATPSLPLDPFSAWETEAIVWEMRQKSADWVAGVACALDGQRLQRASFDWSRASLRLWIGAAHLDLAVSDLAAARDIEAMATIEPTVLRAVACDGALWLEARSHSWSSTLLALPAVRTSRP